MERYDDDESLDDLDPPLGSLIRAQFTYRHYLYAVLVLSLMGGITSSNRERRTVKAPSSPGSGHTTMVDPHVAAQLRKMHLSSLTMVGEQLDTTLYPTNGSR